MKDNSIKKILDAWNDGKPVWLDGEEHEKDKVLTQWLSYSSSGGFELYTLGVSLPTRFKTASLTPPEQSKKKRRKMTPLEMAYKQGVRWVFRNEGSGVWWTSIFTSNQIWDENTTKMAEIRDEGRSLGPWVDCSVEDLEETNDKD
jgi:hypothetical protein